MNRALNRRSVLAAMAIALLATPLAAQPDDGKHDLLEHWKIEKFRWDGPLGASTVIEVENLLGDVRARLSESDHVYLSALTQRHEDDPHQADFRIAEQDGRLKVEVAFVAEEGFDPASETADMAKRRVDLTILVPAGVRLEARTDKGLIEAKGLEGEVVAASTSGDVLAKVTGSLRARTDRGKIQAILLSPEWDATPQLETVTGDISVWLPNGTGAEVRAETNGLITTDYSIEIESRPESDHKTALAKIGKGKRQLSIKSTKGSVRILRLRG